MAAVLILTAVMAFGSTEAQAATTRWVKGRVGCLSTDPGWTTLAVRGVWVESESWVRDGGRQYGNGGAEFARFTRVDAQPWLVNFEVLITTPTATDRVRIVVGCGGSAEEWATTNRTNWYGLGSSTKFINATCAATKGRSGQRCGGWASDTVLIGMPVAGTWSSPATNPKWHPGRGDWATDVFADEGDAVRAHAFGRRGQKVTVRFRSKEKLWCRNESGALRPAGRTVIVDIYRGGTQQSDGTWSGGTKEATVRYAHLTDVPGFTDGEDVRGARIGRAKWWGSDELWLMGSSTMSDPDCYDTSGRSGTHVHVAADNHGGYSCYWPLPLGTAPRIGATVAKAGRTTASTDHQKCAD